MDVYLVWHVAHGDPTLRDHRDELGEVPIDESVDDVKLLGVYSTEEEAAKCVARARILPGFSREPDCFVTGIYTLDEDSTWLESGFH